MFIYLSGHGTSAADTSMTLQMREHTGAFIPYYIKDTANESELHQRVELISTANVAGLPNNAAILLVLSP